MSEYNQNISDIYQLTYDSALSGIAIANLQGELRSVNPAFIDMWGYDDEDEVVGRSVTEFWSNPDKARSVATEVVENGEWTGELLAEKQDGSTFHARASASIVKDEADEPVYLMSSFIDISERTSRERELQRKNEKLEQFAGVISHDLRNPLNVAQGRVELAQTEDDSEHLRAAAKAINRCNAIIDDVLAWAHNGGRVEEVAPVDLAAASNDCWQHVPTAEATLVTETTQLVQADESQLKHLLENLLQNAIKHGGSDVTVTVGEMPNGFYVADDGAGIPPDIREEVFNAGFSDASESTGFGLNIVTQIADSHGWNVAVTESETGGARFEISDVEIVSTDG